MASYLALASLLLIFVAFIELRGKGRPQGFDFLSAISGAFVVVFFVAPFILFLTPPDAPAFYKFVWMKNLPSEDEVYLWAGALINLSYLSISAGYMIVPARKAVASRVRDYSRLHLVGGGVFLALGLASFLFFLEIVGGLEFAREHVWMLRAATPNVGPLAKFAFVKHFSFFVIPGSIFLMQYASRKGGAVAWGVAAMATFLTLCIMVFFQGRYSLASYVVPIFLAMWVMRKTASSKTKLLNICSIIFILGTITAAGKLTKPMTAIVIAPPTDSSQPPNISNLQTNVSSFGLEFAFPLVNVLTAVQNVPQSVGYRWFSDLLMPFLQLVPKRLIPLRDHLPPKLSKQNTLLQAGEVDWEIPVDIVSFGWYSLGVVGVIVSSLGFGCIAKSLEGILPCETYGDWVFRLSWLVMFAALVMYGDLNWFVVEMFHWWVALIFYLALERVMNLRASH